jgi:hypothetical protein
MSAFLSTSASGCSFLCLSTNSRLIQTSRSSISAYRRHDPSHPDISIHSIQGFRRSGMGSEIIEYHRLCEFWMEGNFDGEFGDFGSDDCVELFHEWVSEWLVG